MSDQNKLYYEFLGDLVPLYVKSKIWVPDTKLMSEHGPRAQTYRRAVRTCLCVFRDSVSRDVSPDDRVQMYRDVFYVTRNNVQIREDVILRIWKSGLLSGPQNLAFRQDLISDMLVSDMDYNLDIIADFATRYGNNRFLISHFCARFINRVLLQCANHHDTTKTMQQMNNMISMVKRNTGDVDLQLNTKHLLSYQKQALRQIKCFHQK